MLNGVGVLNSDFPDLDLPNQNVWNYAYPSLKRWGNLTAFIMSNTEDSLTYNEYIEKSLCWGKELKQYFTGSTPPTVSFTMTNNIDCFPLVLGCHSVGATICPIRTDLNTEVFGIMIADAKPDVMVLDPTCYEKFAEAIARSGNNPHIYIRGSPLHGKKDFIEVVNSGDMLDVAKAGQYDSTSRAALLFSSGTTGTPKCAIVSHAAMANSMFLLSQRDVATMFSPDEVGQQRTLFGSLPIAHMSGVELFAVIVPTLGCRVVYMDCETIGELLHNIKKYKPALIKIRNDVLKQLSELESVEDLSCLTSLIFGGSSTNSDDFMKLNGKLGNKLQYMDFYGSTEINIVSAMPKGDTRPNMTGKLLSNVQAKFVDIKEGKIITEPHKKGEVYIKGPGIMEGYLNNSEATQKVLDSDGWFRTGDMGYFDDDRFIKIIDRFYDIITLSVMGNKREVSPTNIERIVQMHPDVEDVGVIGVPDPRCNEVEVPKAFVISRGKADELQIINFVKERAPVELRLTGGVIFVKHLPKDPQGKLIRKYLRDMSWH